MKVFSSKSRRSASAAQNWETVSKRRRRQVARLPHYLFPVFLIAETKNSSFVHLLALSLSLSGLICSNILLSLTFLQLSNVIPHSKDPTTTYSNPAAMDPTTTNPRSNNNKSGSNVNESGSNDNGNSLQRVHFLSFLVSSFLIKSTAAGEH